MVGTVTVASWLSVFRPSSRILFVLRASSTSEPIVSGIFGHACILVILTTLGISQSFLEPPISTSFLDTKSSRTGSIALVSRKALAEATIHRNLMGLT